jgi:hypothetical protein
MLKKVREPRAKPTADRWFVYLLRCADGSLYTGIAKNVDRRCRQHNAGTHPDTLVAVAPSNSCTRNPWRAEVWP